MADEWIKMRHRLLGEPEVKEMAIRLGVTRQHVAGCLLGVWSHADKHAVERPDPNYRQDKCPDADGTDDGISAPSMEGYLAYSTVHDIDHEAIQPGFAQAMADVGWLRIYPNAIGLPQYEVHHSSSAKKRASESKKKQKQRAGKGKSPEKRPAIVPASAGQTSGPEGEGEGERELEGDQKKIQIESKNKNQNLSGGVGGAPRVAPAERTARAATTAGGERDLEGEVGEILAEWDLIEGVSQEHALCTEDGQECVPGVLSLIRSRLRDPHFATHWRAGLAFVRSSDLCRGRVDPKPGFDNPWRAALKWFCSAGKLAEVLSGKHGGNAEGLNEEHDWLDQELSGTKEVTT